MKKAKQYQEIVITASRNKQELLSYADNLIISLDGADISTVDLKPLATMIQYIRDLDWVRHSLEGMIGKAHKGIVDQRNDIGAAKELLPSVVTLARAYKSPVNRINAILSK